MLKNCPHCNVTLVGDEIPLGLFKGNPDNYATVEDAMEDAAFYGWTKENKITFSANCVYMKDMYDKSKNHYECKCCGGEWK